MMAYVPFNEKSLSLALEEASVPAENKDAILSYFQQKDFTQIIQYLEQYRIASLSRLRDTQKQMDRLDFIIYQLKRENT